PPPDERLKLSRLALPRLLNELVSRPLPAPSNAPAWPLSKLSRPPPCWPTAPWLGRAPCWPRPPWLGRAPCWPRPPWLGRAPARPMSPPCWPKPPPCAWRPRKDSRAWALAGPVLLNFCCVAWSRYWTPLRCSGLCCHFPWPPRPPSPRPPWPRPPSPRPPSRCSTRSRARSGLLTLFVKLFALLLLML